MRLFEVTREHVSLWDEFVAGHPEATPYHRWGWCESVELAYGFKPKMYAAMDDNNNIVAVLPSILMKTPFLGTKACALPYCDAGGILAQTSEARDALIKFALKKLEQEGAKKLEHREAKNVEPANLELQEKVRMVLPLPENSELLMASFKSKLRSQIRKAEKNGLRSAVGCDQSFIDGFYQVYTRNMRDLGSPAHSKAWFEAIVQNYQDHVVIANVYKDDIVVGAGLVIFNGHKCSIPWASTNADYNRLAPNMLLYWSLLEYSTDKGCESFDFGRSTPGEGTYKFKAQWGAKPTALDWQDWVNGQHENVSEQPDISAKENNDAAKPINEAKQTKSGLRDKVEAVWRKLPVSTATMLGSKLRKHISL